MAYADHVASSLPCYRPDLSKPALVFAGVFIAVSAIYGTMGTPGTQNLLDDVHVLNAENVVGPVGIDPLAMNCDRDLKRSATTTLASASNQNRCRQARR